MIQTFNLPLTEQNRQDYDCWRELPAELAAMGCQGIEGIWGGGALAGDLPAGLVVGYHLTFFADWLDLYQENWEALEAKFGSLAAARTFYGGLNRETLLDLYRADLARARALGVQYVVFHVSDVSVEEGYTYRWLHSHRQVIDASVEIINILLGEADWPFQFLVENQWWPGFTMTDPDLTERLLSGIHFPNKGIMLDTGHLLNTEISLRTEEEGAAYLRQMLHRHGRLCQWIRGLHLHCSFSGAYVASHTGALPPDLPEEYLERYAAIYSHILQIDQHRPWTDRAIASVVRELSPQFLTHELSVRSRADRREKVACQQTALFG